MGNPLTTSSSSCLQNKRVLLKSSGVLVPAAYWFEIVDHKAGTKETQFSMSHRMHCSSKMSPLQHIWCLNLLRVQQLTRRSCSMRCEQRSLSPSDVPGTCPYLTWNMSPSHVPRTCPHLTSPEHVPISRARNMSPSDVPGTCPLACALYYINFYHGFAQVMVNKRLVVAWACFPVEANAG